MVTRKRIYLSLVIIWLVIIGFFSMATAGIYSSSTKVGACKPNSTNPASFSRKGINTMPYLVTTGYEDVRFQSRGDHMQIAGWYIPAENEATARTIILVHGSGSCRHHNVNLMAAGMLHRNGFNTLNIDLRQFGDSERSNGHHTGGNLESRDVLGAWDWLVETKGFAPESIGLWGSSFGSGVIGVAASAEPRVAAIWVDSFFPSMYLHIRKSLVDSHYPIFLATTIVWYGNMVGEGSLSDPNPRDSMRSYGERPIYIVHGEDDARVDKKYAEELADIVTANGGTAHLWIVEDNPHGGVIWRNVDEYEERMINFFNETLTANIP